jgi:hypothetical protein
MISQRGPIPRDGLFPHRFSLIPNSARDKSLITGTVVDQAPLSVRVPQLQNYRQYGGDSARNP